MNEAPAWRMGRRLWALGGDADDEQLAAIAVGMPVTGDPSHRTGRAAFRHPAPALGCLTAKRWLGHG
jgi:hypothetical protein